MREIAPHYRQFACITATLWAAALVSTAHAEAYFGRLFFSTERRQDATENAPVSAVTNVQPFTDDAFLSIDGIVARSNGPHTVWINGSAYAGNAPNELPDEMAVITQPGATAKVVLKASDSTAQTSPPSNTIHVGETLERASGERQDRLKGGYLRILAAPKIAETRPR